MKGVSAWIQSAALTGAADEISPPVGAFSKCCLTVLPPCKLQTHPDPLFLRRGSINQLPERGKSPWPGVILLGRGAGDVEGRATSLNYGLCRALTCKGVSVNPTSWRPPALVRSYITLCITMRSLRFQPRLKGGDLKLFRQSQWYFL